jgi:hypothetical protein
MSERLCDDCPARTPRLANPQSTERLAAACVMDIEDPEDRRMIQELPGASKLEQAMELPRPERCERLRQELPVERVSPGHAPVGRLCPEIGLVAMVLAGQNMPSDF